MTTEVSTTAIHIALRSLDSFRTACLLGTAPRQITVFGHVIKDELEAEGYMAELNAYLEEQRG